MNIFHEKVYKTSSRVVITLVTSNVHVPELLSTITRHAGERMESVFYDIDRSLFVFRNGASSTSKTVLKRHFKQINTFTNSKNM